MFSTLRRGAPLFLCSVGSFLRTEWVSESAQRLSRAAACDLSAAQDVSAFELRARTERELGGAEYEELH